MGFKYGHGFGYGGQAAHLTDGWIVVINVLDILSRYIISATVNVVCQIGNGQCLLSGVTNVSILHNRLKYEIYLKYSWFTQMELIKMDRSLSLP